MLRRFAMVLLFAFIFPAYGQTAYGQVGQAQRGAQPNPAIDRPSSTSSIVVPAGTTVPLALVNAIWAKRAKIGDAVYAQSTFPVVADGRIAIPPGTYAQGKILSLSRPGWFTPHAQLRIEFTKLIFANGFAVELPALQLQAPPADDVIPAVTLPYVEVSRNSSVLLDAGSQFDMILQFPLSLDAYDVSLAARRSASIRAAQPQSAVVCHPIPGSPGTPDVVVPGTPGTPGTPPTEIPGAPGQPDIIVPGTPATPGTPDTVIPGTPGTPGVPCPPLPVVLPHAKQQPYVERFRLDRAVQIGGKPLPVGAYELRWSELAPLVSVEVLGSGIVAQVRARVVILTGAAPADATNLRANPDGSNSLASVRFAGQDFALYFQ